MYSKDFIILFLDDNTLSEIRYRTFDAVEITSFALDWAKTKDNGTYWKALHEALLQALSISARRNDRLPDDLITPI